MTTTPVIWRAADSISTAGSDVDRGNVTLLGNGGYALVWQDNSHFYFRLYDGLGQVALDKTDLGVGTFSAASFPEVQSVGTDGAFSITWTEESTANSVTTKTLYTRGFDFSGQAQGEAQQIAKGEHVAYGSHVNAGPDGGWVVAYVEPASATDAATHVKLAVFNASGVKQSTIDVGAADESAPVDVAYLGGSKYAVLYKNKDAAYGKIDYAVYDGDHVVKTGEITATDAHIAALKGANGAPNGLFSIIAEDRQNATAVAAYVSDAANDLSTTQLSAEIFNASKGHYEAITALHDGGVAFAYVAREKLADGSFGDWGDVYIRVRSADGTLGDPFKVNAHISASDGTQDTVSISEMADGRLAVSWHDGHESGFTSTAIVDARTSGVTVVGTSHDDIYVGSQFDDTLSGGGGNDLLIGGEGADIIHGGDGVDTVSFQYATAGVTVDLKAGTGSGGEAAGDTYDGIEKLLGSAYSDHLTGSDGADTIDGSGGNDVLIGGAGADALIGGAGSDTASYEDADGGVTVNLASGVGSGSDAEGDTFSGVENVVGSAHNDALTGDGNANALYGGDGNDVLDGGAGADYMNGGAGDDSFYVDNSGDQVAEAANGGTDTVYTSATFALASYVENMVAIGGGAISLTGNDLNNTLTGNYADNVINGGVGADTMVGGGGNDIYYVDNPGDVIIDSSGSDTVIVSGSISLANFSGIDNVVLAGAVASVNGNDAANLLTGNGYANALWGYGGNDTIEGLGGNDKLFGGTGNDVIRGGAGNDRLLGEAGNDTIYGSAGKDVMTGGAGKDFFVFDYKFSKKYMDKVTDFNVKYDTIWLDNALFKKNKVLYRTIKKGTEHKPAKLNKHFFTIGDHAQDKDDFFIYNSKKGILYYDADGSGHGKAVEIASLTRKLKMTYHDIGFM